MNGKAWRTVLAVAGAAVAAMLAPAAAGAASWGEELSLSGPTTPEFRAHGAGAVVDEAGNATYLWLQSIPGGFTGDAVARAQTYRADGTVSPVRNVTPPSLPGLTLGAGLGIDASGQVRVVWLQRQEQCTPVCKYAYQVETVALDGNALPVGEPVKVVERAFNDPKIDSLTFDIGPDGTMAFGFLSLGEGLEELEFLRLDPGESTPVSLEAEAEGPFEQSNHRKRRGEAKAPPPLPMSSQFQPPFRRRKPVGASPIPGPERISDHVQSETHEGSTEFRASAQESWSRAGRRLRTASRR